MPYAKPPYIYRGPILGLNAILRDAYRYVGPRKTYFALGARACSSSFYWEMSYANPSYAQPS